MDPKAYRLKFYLDARGWLMAPEPELSLGHVAYVYATMCHPGVVKGWHRHKAHTDRLMCVSGTARIVTAVTKGGEGAQPDTLVTRWHESQETVCGPLDPAVVVIPPGVWHAFTPAGNEPCVIVNFPDMLYDPDDEEKRSLAYIEHNWREVSG